MTGTTRTALIRDLRLKGVKLTAVGDAVRVDAPKGAVTPDVRHRLQALKPRLLSVLRDEQQVLGDVRTRVREPGSVHRGSRGVVGGHALARIGRLKVEFGLEIVSVVRDDA